MPNTNNLKKLIQDIPNTGIPEKLTTTELEARGFKSKNDRPIIAVLKFINFINDSGTPIENWTAYRDTTQSGSTMATALREAYAEVFRLYPDANTREVSVLRNFFTTRTKAGKQVVDQTVTTFKALSELGDFGNIAPSTTPGKSIEETPKLPNKSATIPESQHLPININITIQLPPTENQKVYDAFFESLKKHLLSKS